ncbi:MAG TPA: IS110 family transposase [Clostridiaceae bacterium]|nr:IS110 family transposase [Clostridiaceae bacterium]
MYYLGIDIGKNNHEAGFIRDDGSHVGKSLRFSNSREGFEKLLLFMEQRLPEHEAFCIGMEATGHYWLALYSFLREKGFVLHVINPIQSDSLRNFHIRQQKTDSVDCFLVADVIRFGKFSETHLADEDILVLRNLARFRESLKDSCADYKRQVITVLDQVFPEYDTLFSSIFGESSKAFLKTYGTPDQVVEVNTKSLATLLRKASRGRHSTDKAREIKSLAANSVGLTLCADAFAFQIRILIEQIEFTEKQIDEIDKKISKQLKKLNSVILTIPGVGPATGAIILGEIGDIGRFSNPKKLVAFAGIDPTSYQSGNFVGQHNRLSKKGSPYLRRAVWMSALIAARYDPVFKAFYEKKRREGKAHGTALGAVARKLLYTIHAVLKANEPYEVRLDTIE